MADARIKDWMEAWKAEVKEAAQWKAEALQHCNRADRAEALLAAQSNACCRCGGTGEEPPSGAEPSAHNDGSPDA